MLAGRGTTKESPDREEHTYQSVHDALCLKSDRFRTDFTCRSFGFFGRSISVGKRVPKTAVKQSTTGDEVFVGKRVSGMDKRVLNEDIQRDARCA